MKIERWVREGITVRADYGNEAHDIFKGDLYTVIAVIDYKHQINNSQYEDHIGPFIKVISYKTGKEIIGINFAIGYKGKRFWHPVNITRRW